MDTSFEIAIGQSAWKKKKRRRQRIRWSENVKVDVRSRFLLFSQLLICLYPFFFLNLPLPSVSLPLILDFIPLFIPSILPSFLLHFISPFHPRGARLLLNPSPSSFPIIPLSFLVTHSFTCYSTISNRNESTPQRRIFDTHLMQCSASSMSLQPGGSIDTTGMCLRSVRCAFRIGSRGCENSCVVWCGVICCSACGVV